MITAVMNPRPRDTGAVNSIYYFTVYYFTVQFIIEMASMKLFQVAFHHKEDRHLQNVVLERGYAT